MGQDIRPLATDQPLRSETADDVLGFADTGDHARRRRLVRPERCGSRHRRLWAAGHHAPEDRPTDISAEIGEALQTWNDVPTAQTLWGAATLAVDASNNPVDFNGANYGTAFILVAVAAVAAVPITPVRAEKTTS